MRARGELEHAARLVGTPESMVSEGIAEVALDVLLGDEGHAFGAAHAAEHGVGYDPEVARRARTPAARCRTCRSTSP